jgi:hypothetical protein
VRIVDKRIGDGAHMHTLTSAMATDSCPFAIWAVFLSLFSQRVHRIDRGSPVRREESSEGSADCERSNCSNVRHRITAPYSVKQACAEISDVESSGDT